jgi:opacity protein-like surface antigen
MRLSVTMIATAAFAFSLMPTCNLFAGEAARPLTGAAENDRAADSSAAAVSDSVAWLPLEPMLADSVRPSIPYSGGPGGYTPRVELFLGYSYLRATPTMASGNRLVWLNGGSASVAFNLNRYLGIVGDFGGFNDTRLQPTSANGTPSSVADSSGTVFTYLFGPRLSLRKYNRVTPYVQVLFGGIHASDVTLSSGCSGSGCTLLPTENSFAMTAGGGLDIRVHRHLAIRIVQAEYMMTKFENHTTGATASQNDMRLSTGLVFRFGGNSARSAPEFSPLAYSCSVNPSAVFPGDTIAVSGTALNLDPAKTIVYTWSVDGGTVAGTDSTATIDTRDIAAGIYTLKGHVSEGNKPGENADCTAGYVVKALEPPTVSCLANPPTVNSGDTSTIMATGISPQNRPLTYSYSSTFGSVSGSGSTATLTTGGAAAGAITVTCNIADDKGQTASGTTSVTVVVPTVPNPVTSELCPVNFARDARRPSRVDNEAKACLDQVALSLQSNSDAKLVLVGNAANNETDNKKLAAQRAVNTRTYLVNEKGIDAARIAVYTGSQDEKIVSTILIPAGATFDANGDAAVQ